MKKRVILSSIIIGAFFCCYSDTFGMKNEQKNEKSVSGEQNNGNKGKNNVPPRRRRFEKLKTIKEETNEEGKEFEIVGDEEENPDFIIDDLDNEEDDESKIKKSFFPTPTSGRPISYDEEITNLKKEVKTIQSIPYTEMTNSAQLIEDFKEKFKQIICDTNKVSNPFTNELQDKIKKSMESNDSASNKATNVCKILNGAIEELELALDNKNKNTSYSENKDNSSLDTDGIIIVDPSAENDDFKIDLDSKDEEDIQKTLSILQDTSTISGFPDSDKLLSHNFYILCNKHKYYSWLYKMHETLKKKMNEISTEVQEKLKQLNLSAEEMKDYSDFGTLINNGIAPSADFEQVIEAQKFMDKVELDRELGNQRIDLFITSKNIDNTKNQSKAAPTSSVSSSTSTTQNNPQNVNKYRPRNANKKVTPNNIEQKPKEEIKTKEKKEIKQNAEVKEKKSIRNKYKKLKSIAGAPDKKGKK